MDFQVNNSKNNMILNL